MEHWSKYHHFKHLAIRKALEYAGEGRDVYVYETSSYVNRYEVRFSPLTSEDRLVVVVRSFQMFDEPTVGSVRTINKAYREQEGVRLANRAINRAQKWRLDGGVFDANYSYICFLEQELSDIVNNRF